MTCASEYSCEYGSAKYYAICGFGGILSCGLTHTAVVPLDLVKCRIQVRTSRWSRPRCPLLLSGISYPGVLGGSCKVWKFAERFEDYCEGEWCSRSGVGLGTHVHWILDAGII